MPSYPLDTSVSVTLDGSGNGQVSIGPQIVREHWQPSSIAVGAGVSADQLVKDAQCVLYWGTTAGKGGTFISQTATGSSGDTCGWGQDTPTGYLFTAIWSGGDPGVSHTMHITGQRTVGSSG